MSQPPRQRLADVIDPLDSRRAERAKQKATDASKKTFKEAADIEGMQVSAWVRQTCRDGARKTLAKIGKAPDFNGRGKGG